MQRARRLRTIILAVVVMGGTVQAQWISQTIPMRPGWNAIHLEVQPSPAECDEIFKGLPVEGVWMWNKRFSPVEFVLDPETPLAPAPHWLMWLPSTNSESFLSQVGGLQAGHSYLVKVRTNAATFNLVVKGQATIPHLVWFPHALNLVGFPVNPVAPPTFSDFFNPTPMVDTSQGYENELYTLDASGRGRTIVQPYRDRIAPGVAYWVKCNGALDYEGPLRVTTDQADQLDFGGVVEELGIAVENLSTGREYTVTIKQIASEAPPAGQAELAGPVPLSHLVSGTGAGGDLTWSNLPGQGLTRTLAAGETWHLQLGVRRNDMAPYVLAGTNGAAYQSLLRVTDSEQSLRIHVPVVAEKDEVRRLSQAKADPVLGAHHSDEGLWVGQAVVNEVTCPSYSTTNLLPTESASQIRLILHVNTRGETKLLQRVYLAWEGPETNGAYALYTDEAAVPASSPEVDRISSAAFPLMGPVVVTNCDTNFLGMGLTNRMGATVTVAFDDPTNPFRHPYHPLLDNKDGSFQPYTNAVETKTVTRSITMDFGSDLFTNAVPDPFYGINEIGGVYEEVLTGLREQPIHVRGAIYLKRVSSVNELN